MSASSIHDGQWWTQSCSGLRQVAMMLRVHRGAFHVKSRRQHFSALSLFPLLSWALVGSIGIPFIGHLIVNSRLSLGHWPAMKCSITDALCPRVKAPLSYRYNYKPLVGSLLPGSFNPITALGSSRGHMSSTVTLTLTRCLVPRKNSLWRVPLVKSESSSSPPTIMLLLRHRAHLAWRVDKWWRSLMSYTSPAFYTASCCTMKLSHPSQCFQLSSSFLPLHPAATLHCVFSHRVLVCSSGSQPRRITRVYTIWGASRPSLTNNSEGEPTPGIENFCLVTHGFLEQHHQTHLPSNCFFFLFYIF